MGKNEARVRRRTRIREHAKRLHNEFKKSFSTAIITAFGLITALAWKDVITAYLNKINTLTILQGQIISAVVVTFLAAIAIVIVTRIAPPEN